MRFGYGRVSTDEQNLDRQLDALAKAGCDQIFMEKLSGKDRNRPELNKLLDLVKAGDVVVVHKLDRLGRSTIDLIQITNQLREKGVDFVSISENFDTTNAVGRLYFNIMAVLAQFEREQTLDRINHGISVARKNGKHLGRPTKVAWADFVEAYESGLTVKQMADKFDTSDMSIYRMLNKYKLVTLAKVADGDF